MEIKLTVNMRSGNKEDLGISTMKHLKYDHSSYYNGIHGYDLNASSQELAEIIKEISELDRISHIAIHYM